MEIAVYFSEKFEDPQQSTRRVPQTRSNMLLTPFSKTKDQNLYACLLSTSFSRNAALKIHSRELLFNLVLERRSANLG
jgi:hypothetical protein